MLKNNYKFKIALVIFAVVLFLLPTHPVKACVLGWDPISSCILEGTSYFVFLIFTIVGKFIVVLAGILQWAINLRVYPDGGIPVIYESWKIMRNFANVFFIVALIIMAFATIFDVFPGAAKYNARALFGKFLFTALLINFSLVLGVIVINGAQVLSNTFLTSIGDMSGRLGQTLNPSLLLPNPGETTLTASSIDSGTFGAFFSLIFALILAITFLFSLLTAFIFTFIRIPILWALLIVSPIAWILNIFPAGEGMFKKWWHTFIGWNMFLPIFLFFLYFGLYFLSNQTAVIAAIAQQSADQSLGEGIPFSIQTLFFYILSSIFIIGGTMVAMKASMFSGTGVVQVAGWARGVASRRLGLTAAGTAATAKWKQVQEEGLPGRFGKLYGGDYGLAQQTGRFGARFGVRGADIKNQSAFVERAGKDYKDFERQYQNGQLTEAQIVAGAKLNATDPRGFAYRKLAAKIGQLDPEGEILTTTLQQLSKNPLATEDFAKSASEGKFSKMKGKNLARMAAAESGADIDPATGASIPYDYTSLKGSIAARREMFRYVLTDKKAMSGLGDSQIDAGISVFGGHTTAEGKNFLKEVGKINPSFAVDYNSDGTRNADLRTDAEEGFEKAYSAPPTNEFQLKTHMFGGYLKSGDMKDTAGIKKDTWENSPEFKESMKLYISQLKGQARKNYINRLERALLDTAGGDRKLEILDTEILSSPTTTGVMVGGRIPPTAPTAPL